MVNVMIIAVISFNGFWQYFSDLLIKDTSEIPSGKTLGVNRTAKWNKSFESENV